VSDRRQGCLLAGDRSTSSHERNLTGSDFGPPVSTVRCEKDRELLSRLHMSSGAGTSRRAGCDAEHERRGQSDDQVRPDPVAR
jgi:hypothetical protein